MDGRIMNDIESDSRGFNSLFPELRDLPTDTPRGEPLPGLRPKVLLKPLLPFIFTPVFITAVLAIFFSVVVEVSHQKPQPTANATIIKVENVSTLTSESGTVVRYRFPVEGKSYDGLLTTIAAERRILKPGDHLPVVYDPANPNRSQEKPQDMDVAGMIAFAVFLPIWALFIMGMCFVPFLGPRAKVALRARGLWKSGRVAQGTLAFVKPPSFMRQYGLGSQEVVFRFRDQLDCEHTVSVGCDNNWLINQLTPGTGVVVLYDSKKPERAILLEPFLA
jgi:hypothetical protein